MPPLPAPHTPRAFGGVAAIFANSSLVDSQESPPHMGMGFGVGAFGAGGSGGACGIPNIPAPTHSPSGSPAPSPRPSERAPSGTAGVELREILEQANHLKYRKCKSVHERWPGVPAGLLMMNKIWEYFAALSSRSSRQPMKTCLIEAVVGPKQSLVFEVLKRSGKSASQ